MRHYTNTSLALQQSFRSCPRRKNYEPLGKQDLGIIPPLDLLQCSVVVSEQGPRTVTGNDGIPVRIGFWHIREASVRTLFRALLPHLPQLP